MPSAAFWYSGKETLSALREEQRYLRWANMTHQADADGISLDRTSQPSSLMLAASGSKSAEVIGNACEGSRCSRRGGDSRKEFLASDWTNNASLGLAEWPRSAKTGRQADNRD